MTPLFVIVALVAGAAVGFLLGARRSKADTEKMLETAEQEAKSRARRVEDDARAAGDSLRLQAESEAREIRNRAERQAEQELRDRRSELDKTEARLASRDEKLDERASRLDRQQSDLAEEDKGLQRQKQSLADKERALQSKTAELTSRLETVAALSREDARRQVLDSVLDQARLDAAREARKIEELAVEEAEKRAKKVLAVAVQRYAGEFVAERCVSVVHLPSDEMKGRIIGREGRNIRAIEAAMGVDLVIDDTPEAIVVSCFDPVRRETARIALERLIADGRIHPSRVEEIFARAQSEMEKTLRDAGERAAFELGITGLHADIVRTIGRLKYRTSYGQNIWSHSIEVGFLCGLMAAELGLNVKLARRAGLLHDIGKAMDHEQEGGHATIGANFIKRFNEDEIVVNAVAAHHEEVRPNSVIAHLVMAGDALSGARPGARREVLESYVQRLEDLERISRGFPGVDHSFAVQAGREVRVVVANDKVNDDQAALLSRDIARKIEQELTYPGQIRVTVIREVKATEIAR